MSGKQYAVILKPNRTVPRGFARLRAVSRGLRAVSRGLRAVSRGLRAPPRRRPQVESNTKIQ
jgi:hypothetical protein